MILDQLVAVRSAMESQMAGDAATRATGEELAAIRHTLGPLDEQVSTPERFTETDVELHDLNMKASGNTLGRSIMRIVHAQARTARLYTGIADATACCAANDEHRVIVERLEARGAAQAMSSHIVDQAASPGDRARAERSGGVSGAGPAPDALIRVCPRAAADRRTGAQRSHLTAGRCPPGRRCCSTPPPTRSRSRPSR
ncbi:FadR/GntR family transcriptional regulator [Streptomyces regalis]|uniref:GntR C-terminal domain-containing protein n=1 Tax=Streptomyces regalis TaxID=68262 RepID=A0A101JTI4_9ACTN|nr:FCD domain-containing protein [Streptomyces regalis]KUL32151.1 hypothetical protein ADL12_23420 [Streptomyces regalis]